MSGWDQFYKVVRVSGIPKVWTSKKGEFEKSDFVPVFLIIYGIMIRGNSVILIRPFPGKLL
jgi:hypothetical protein